VVSQTSATTVAEQFHDLIHSNHMYGLWELASLMTPHPETKLIPYMWPHDLLQRVVEKSGEAVPVGEERRAMQLFNPGLDGQWATTNTLVAAVQVLLPGEVARAQFPGTATFQGWIAFNPKVSLPADDLFLTDVHELGHLLGLPHSSNPSSAMYFLTLDGPVFLDSADLAALAARHRLRAAAGTGEVTRSAFLSWRRVSPSNVSESDPTASQNRNDNSHYR